MYRIEIPSTIHQLMTIFYRLGMWNRSDTTTFRDFCRKLFCSIHFVSFVLSVALGALSTDDTDECVFLTAVAVLLIVQAYRIWIILWDGSRFMLLIHQIGTHSTNDQEEFIRINKKLNVSMKFLRYFIFAIVFSLCFDCVLFPFITKELTLNIAFPLNWHNSDVAFCIASAYLGGGAFCSLMCCILTNIIWYLMLSFSFEYQLLGNQIRHMGTIKADAPQLKVSLAAQQKLFFKDFIAAIQTYDKINGYIDFY